MESYLFDLTANESRIPEPNLLYPIQTWSQEFRAENIGINSSKQQSGILLHKRIHIYGQYNF